MYYLQLIIIFISLSSLYIKYSNVKVNTDNRSFIKRIINYDIFPLLTSLKNRYIFIVSMFLYNNVFSIILFIGIAVRIVFFGYMPAGFNQDEASIGYDAYSLLTYGIDRNGFQNPIHFVSWGSGQNALYAYLVMPIIALWGLKVITVRSISLIFALITLIFFYLLVKKISNKITALLSLFILTISPWHIMISRWALESNLFPAIFIIGVYFLVISLDKSKYLPFSMFFFALSLYSYGTSYFIIPIFLLLTLPYIIIHKKINLKLFVLSFIIFIIVALPMLTFVVINVFKMDSLNTSLISIPKLTGTPRFSTVTILFRDFSLQSILINLLKLINLIIHQNDNCIWNSTPKFGIFYTFSISLLILGLAKLILHLKRNIKQFNLNVIMLGWIFASMIVALITDVNINRLNIIYLPLIYIIATGITFVKNNVKLLTIPIITVYLIAFTMFSNAYFTWYQDLIGQAFYDSLGDAINYTSTLDSKKTIYITDQIEMPYIFVLFYEKIDPKVFLTSVQYYNPGEEFQRVKSFDRYRFGLKNICKSKEEIYLINHNQEDIFDEKYFDFKRFKYYTVVTWKYSEDAY